jgi:hypothetical protein
MKPAYAIDCATFNIVDIIFLRPLQTFFKAPKRTIERICMETNFNHRIEILSWTLAVLD